MLFTDISLGLRDVRVTIPTIVRKGDTVKLICNYDMENDTLYSIKWYKGKREFYRFTPNESLVIKTFPVMGIQVQVKYTFCLILNVRIVGSVYFNRNGI